MTIPNNYRSFIRHLTREVGLDKRNFHKIYIMFKNFDVLKELFVESFTVKELAERIGCGEPTVRKKLRSLSNYNVTGSKKAGKSFYHFLTIDNDLVNKLDDLTRCENCSKRIAPPKGGRTFVNVATNTSHQFCNNLCKKKWMENAYNN